jgi:putative restriction endonuclease
VRLFVGVTDSEWFEQLGSLPAVDEVNFWQPSGSSHFRALSPGEIFLFKLHSPHDCIVGASVTSKKAPQSSGLLARRLGFQVAWAWCFAS